MKRQGLTPAELRTWKGIIATLDTDPAPRSRPGPRGAGQRPRAAATRWRAWALITLPITLLVSAVVTAAFAHAYAVMVAVMAMGMVLGVVALLVWAARSADR